ncbi:G patch domain-containing protein 4 [Terramyces sp. JEL0728]|nr:G patch domain-containing protein 4 [Terramyces sp. JEL0728]
MSNETFAERQLKKYGWKKGQGLGKNGEGISKAISVGVKNDTDGLGAKSDEWSFQWWDHIFNKASSTIKIDQSDKGITIEKDETKEKEKQLLYGAFVKSGDTTVEKKDYSIKVTDEELFLACEGRTARKGARGEQSGKLKRAELADKGKVEKKRKDKKDKDRKKKDKRDKKDKDRKKKDKREKKSKSNE